MIEYVRGKLVAQEMDYVVVETHGLGYKIYTANPYRFDLGEEVVIYTYHYVREDWVALYGFKTKKERDLFAQVLQVAGIGPKSALAIVGLAHPQELALAIQEEDLTFLTKIPGIGRKTAQRLIVELKDKLGDLAAFDALERKGASAARGTAAQTGAESVNEASSVLEALGFTIQEINRLMPELRKMAEQGLGTEELVKHSLKLLAK